MGKRQSRPAAELSNTDVSRDPPFFSECEVLHEAGPTSIHLFNNCKKNPGHPTFIPVNDFKMDHLPAGNRTEEVMQTIKDCSDRTVKVMVQYTSLNRPATFPNTKNPYPFVQYKGSTRKTRIGTGFVLPIYRKAIRGQYCPCGPCKISDEPVNEYREFVVTTAAHVIFDDSEAEKSTFELLYDSEKERGKVKRLNGVRIMSHIDFMDGYHWARRDQSNEGSEVRRCFRDKVQVLCVSHDIDLDLTSYLPSQANDNWTESVDDVHREIKDNSFGVIISHPHGMCKHITLGNRLYFNNPDPLNIMYNERRSDGKWLRDAMLTGFPCQYTSIPKTITCKISIATEVKFTNGNIPTSLDDKTLKRFKKLCYQPESDSESYRLKKDMLLAVPADTPYFCQRSLNQISWVAFPRGTQFITKNGNNSFPLPDNTMFSIPFYRSNFPYNQTEFFETYAIDTCPGCSGAPLIREFNWFGHTYATTHSGALIDGTNKCALEYL